MAEPFIASLPSAYAPSALAGAADWIAGVLTGSVGTTIAVLAIAGLGLAMLLGRLSVRDGARVVLGCFILFGAPVSARALVDLAQSATQVPAEVYAAPVSPSPPPMPAPSQSYDPHAGASLPQ